MSTTAQVNRAMLDSYSYHGMLTLLKERYALSRVDEYPTSLNGVGHL